MTITPLLLCFPLLTAAYNLEVNNPIIYKEPSLNNQETQSTDSFFGYTVLLASQEHILPNGLSFHKPWLLVGAPKANYSRNQCPRINACPREPGVAYRCTYHGGCSPIKVMNPNDEPGFIKQVRLSTMVEIGDAWFGAAMSLNELSDTLTVCAPRTIVRIYVSQFDYQITMQGACYTGKLSSGSLDMEDKNFATYDFRKQYWQHPVNGFAVHYPISQANSSDLIIGSPKHEAFGSVRKMGQKIPAHLPIDNELSQFGYALTSGYYQGKNQLMLVAGAPGLQYTGQVAMMDPRANPLSITLTINGKEVGEYFGASLATGDMNNDGLDDLIVGAPHGKNGNGRVHIFLGNKAGEFFEADILLEGRVEDGQYGYAVTSGDLDGDGFDDLIVGAPWEDHGVIYVYNGDAKLRELHFHKPTQRIAASKISADTRAFGFSLSKPVDVDGNGFSDIAIGAYASGHAVILRSRPVVRSVVTLSTVPKVLHRNSTSFVVKACLDHYPRFAVLNKLWGRKLQITVDEDYKRVGNHRVEFLSVGDSPEHCLDRDFQLQNDTENFVDAIEIVGVYELWNEFCSPVESTNHLCPAEYKARNVTARMTLPFDIGCGNDEICHVSIYMELEFRGIRNSTWIIGSDDLSLVLRIANDEEPAYLTTVTFDIPEGISLGSNSGYCREDEAAEASRVTCDVGNPLTKEMEKKIITLDLDMSHVRNSSADGSELDFRVEVKTRGVNRQPSVITIPLHLRANASVALSGKAYDDNYYLKYDEKPGNFTFQHSYQISRFGQTPISEATLTILVPYKLYDFEFLTINHKPRVSLLDRFHECSVTGVSIKKPRFVEKSPTEAGLEDDFHLDTLRNLSKSLGVASHDDFTAVPTSDTISHTMQINSTEWKSDDDARTQLHTMSKSEFADINDLNCSAPNVTCGAVVCKIPSLKTDRDVVKLQLQLVVDDSTLAGGDEDKAKAVHITTEASVQVLDRKMEFIVPGAGIIVPVTTTFHRAPNVGNDISIWVILGSIFLGLLALSLIGLGLWKVGFFKRHKKEQLEELKKSEKLPSTEAPPSEDQNNGHM